MIGLEWCHCNNFTSLEAISSNPNIFDSLQKLQVAIENQVHGRRSENWMKTNQFMMIWTRTLLGDWLIVTWPRKELHKGPGRLSNETRWCKAMQCIVSFLYIYLRMCTCIPSSKNPGPVKCWISPKFTVKSTKNFHSC